MNQCKDCGEQMEGDGFTVVFHCPNTHEYDYYDMPPDSGPYYCGMENEDDYHWADDHILPDFIEGVYHTYDEAGLLYDTFDTRREARAALDKYAKTL